MNSGTSTPPAPTLVAAEWSGVILVGALILAVCQWATNAERNYRRFQLLAAYRRRHSWKKSDIARLRSLGVSKIAQRRMERLEGKGRPVVKPFLTLDEVIVTKLTDFNALFDPDISPEVRRKAFKSWPWWKHFVEALYRGEHAIAKERGLKNPASETELLVGAALGISAASVHSICGEIRAMRRANKEPANSESMTLNEFGEWMETGSNNRALD